VLFKQRIFVFKTMNFVFKDATRISFVCYRLWSKSRYKCFEAFDDQLEERILQSVKKRFRAFAASLSH